jgi:formylglycine-generating enzyme required for sulfatase activity
MIAGLPKRHIHRPLLASALALTFLPRCAAPAEKDAPPAAARLLPAPEATTPPETPEPEPAPEKPAVPTLPDGTAILPCLDPPPPGMACIPGGPFVRGRDDGPQNERPAATIHLQTFYMDLYEVTSAEYRACKAAGSCPRGGPLYNDFSRARQPIVGPPWYAAVTFCQVAGKHLPTEAQWEKAARGTDGALYPWGNDRATCEHAVIEDERGRSCGVPKKHEHPEKGRTFEVGSRPPAAFGLYDMAGNSWEWVADWATESYQACGEACSGVDPLGPCGGKEPCEGHTEKVVRGGSWYWNADYATATHRRFHIPANPVTNFHHFGFRCAASASEAEALAAKAGPTPSPS